MAFLIREVPARVTMTARAQLKDPWFPGEHCCSPLTALGSEQILIPVPRTWCTNCGSNTTSFHNCTKFYSFYFREVNAIEDVGEGFDYKPLLLTPSLANAPHSLPCPLPLQASTLMIIFSATIIWFANRSQSSERFGDSKNCLQTVQQEDNKTIFQSSLCIGSSVVYLLFNVSSK